MTPRSVLGTGLFAIGLGLAAAIAGATSAPPDGRYKKQGDRCVWDAKDSGPNQCTPVTAGRFKKERGSCVWAANESGSNECRPSKGRFKKEGSACVWNGEDSGSDQCDPHKSK
jgi:hypothetical protein